MNRIRIFLAEEKKEDTLGGDHGGRLSPEPHVHGHVSSDCGTSTALVRVGGVRLWLPWGPH